jgi:glycosyltransferase involved in cell wall biosynthesis
VRRRKYGPYDAVFYLPSITPLLEPGTSLPPGGAETQIFLLTRALAKRGARICIVAFSSEKGAPYDLDGIDVIGRPPSKVKQRLLGKIREALAIWSILRKLDARVIVARSANPTTGLAGIFARLTRHRFVYSSASNVDFYLERLERKRRNLHLYNLGIRLADTIVVQTEHQVRLCRSRFHREPVLIKSVAETAQPRAEEPAAFLWIGRLIDYKQPFAFFDLAREMPEARFWMVGAPHGEVGRQLQQEVEREADKVINVELMSPRPRSELMDLIDKAVAVVSTSIYEGMPNIFLEGWARGVPALALCIDPDGVIERYGLGSFAGGSTERLTELARELWSRRRDQSDLATRCRDYVALSHSPDAVAARWAEVLGVSEADSEGGR